MASKAPIATVSLYLFAGEDDFAVKQHARQLFQKWCAEVGGFDHERIDAFALNSGEAFRAISSLREAMQTLPFFGGGKVIWWDNCSFLGDDRTGSSSGVTEALQELAQELKAFRWDGVRLIISAGKVDKRKAFYKTLDKLGSVELFEGWSAEDKDWHFQAERVAREKLQVLGKEVSEENCARLVADIGPNPRLLANEIEKLSIYLGARILVEAGDIEAVVTRNKSSRAFALADALGQRNLPRLLKVLDEELWAVKTDSSRSEIGLLYGLISKVRVMLLLKEMIQEGMIKPESPYPQFKVQLERIPAESLPSDKKFNPQAMHPFLLFNSLSQAANYTTGELVQAMETLLECNLRIVSSGQDDVIILQQTLINIVQSTAVSPKPSRR